MVNTCVGSQPHDQLAEYTIFSLVNPACFVVLCLIRIYLFYVEFLTAPSLTATRPMYGIGALQFLKKFLGLGMANSFSATVLFFFFYHIEGLNSKEFACQVQAGILGVFFPLFFIFSAVAVLFTNYLRAFWTRFKFANLCKAWLKPARSTDVEVNFVCIGAARGTFIPPMVEILKMGLPRTSRLNVIAMDAYSSKLNTESEKWLLSNMAIEAVADERTSVIVAQTDYKVFPFTDNSIDVMLLPIGILLGYFGTEDNPETKKKLMSEFFREVYRVLKPNGSLLTSNMLFVMKTFEEAVEESPFGLSNSRKLDSMIFWSWIPAKITILTKPAAVGEQVNPAVADATVNEPIEAACNETVSPLYSSTAARSPSSNISGNVQCSALTRNSTTARDSAAAIKQQTWAWFPPGLQWRFVEFLTAFTLCLWILYVLLTWYYLNQLEVPSFLPWGRMVSSLFTSNASILPFVIYWILARLRETAFKAELELRTEIKAVTDQNRLSNFSKTHNAAWEQAFMTNNMITRVWRAYKSEMFDVLLLLTLNSALGWLPYFALDSILIQGAGYSANSVGTINTITSVVVIIFFIKIIPPLMRWYSSVKKRQEDQQESEAKDEVNQEEARWTMASRSTLSKVPVDIGISPDNL